MPLTQIPLVIQTELDKLDTRLRKLEAMNQGAVSAEYVNKLIDDLKRSFKVELDALKRRAG